MSVTVYDSGIFDIGIFGYPPGVRLSPEDYSALIVATPVTNSAEAPVLPDSVQAGTLSSDISAVAIRNHVKAILDYGNDS